MQSRPGSNLCPHWFQLWCVRLDLADYGRHRLRFPNRPSADKTDGWVLRSEVERPRFGIKTRRWKKTRTRTQTTAPLDNAKQQGRRVLHIPFHHVLLRKRLGGKVDAKAVQLNQGSWWIYRPLPQTSFGKLIQSADSLRGNRIERTKDKKRDKAAASAGSINVRVW